jgi:PKD repeat protein
MIVLKRLTPFFLLTFLLMAGCKKDPYKFNDLTPTVKSFFAVSATVFDMDQEIRFTNSSENAESFSWDFGDGTKSTEKDPVKTYAAAGNYTVTLKAVGPGGTGNYSTDLTIIDPSQTGSAFKEMYFIEYSNSAIKKISLEPGSLAEVVSDITGIRGVGLAYDSVNAKIYYSDFETANGKIWRMDLDGGNREAIVSGITDPYSVVLNLTGGKVYWADDDGNVGRANLDGTGLEKSFIQIADGQLRGIAYSAKKDILYFYEVNNEDLYAAKSDGTGVAKIVEGAYGYSIYVDDVNGKLYYEDRNEPSIMQINLDGSGRIKIADVPSTRVHGMAIDYNENKFYWTDRDKGLIKRSNLDGSGAENFLSNLKSPRGMFIK